eukprot:COSAG01_NODE_1824_length_9141_cov_10.234461_5_plen_82_part_00
MSHLFLSRNIEVEAENALADRGAAPPCTTATRRRPSETSTSTACGLLWKRHQGSSPSMTSIQVPAAGTPGAPSPEATTQGA